jgi:hypothetical protein
MTGWEQLTAKRAPTYPCGHPRTPDNTREQTFGGKYVARRCKTCHAARIKNAFHTSQTIPVRDSRQWDACYRSIITHYLRKSYLERNPFFVEEY